MEYYEFTFRVPVESEEEYDKIYDILCEEIGAEDIDDKKV